jgi:hypothetical protein
VGNNAAFGNRPDVTFEGVTMDLADFMEVFVGPMAERRDAFLAPVRPIITVLTASIKVLETLQRRTCLEGNAGDNVLQGRGRGGHDH